MQYVLELENEEVAEVCRVTRFLSVGDYLHKYMERSPMKQLVPLSYENLCE
ncbi:MULTISPECIES: hypothetical protein [unclassified Nostoc]|uniref:hypothetical protein n=1 Tax=unclassified Nostoc TaxID=2593658 RepID=UPI002AD47B2B|nr:hypothetical protein [Nostoc sp. ChiQUE02]MDZ8235045.1 hypothetical protein [Nostoc sp. ChiQUE02]